MSVEEVVQTALPVAEKQGWLSNEKNLAVKPKPYLVRYEKSKKLIWAIHFYYSVTGEDWWDETSGFNSIEFASVMIDDETEEILSAEFIRPQFSQN